MFDLTTLGLIAAGIFAVVVIVAIVLNLVSNKDVIAVGKKEEHKVVEVKSTVKSAEPKKPETVTVSNDLSELTVSELKDMAKEHGITGVSKMNKSDLIEAINAHIKAHH
jgi:hypothetical protein